MFKETILPLVAMLLAVLGVTLILTGAFLVNDAHNCHEQGGHYSVDGATAWCRF
jgi:hypothetical protein